MYFFLVPSQMRCMTCPEITLVARHISELFMNAFLVLSKPSTPPSDVSTFTTKEDHGFIMDVSNVLSEQLFISSPIVTLATR